MSSNGMQMTVRWKERHRGCAAALLSICLLLVSCASDRKVLIPDPDVRPRPGGAGEIRNSTTPLSNACLGAHGSKNPIAIRIGHAASISGAFGHLGRDSEDGARLAIEELNAQCMSVGDRLARFELLAQDDAGDPARAIAVANALVKSGANGVVGHLTSATTIPASNVYFAAGVPQIAAGASNPLYTLRGYRTAFNILANNTQLSAILGRHVVQGFGWRKVVIVEDGTSYGRDSALGFERGVKSAGGNVLAIAAVTKSTTDYASTVSKLKDLNPDVVLLGSVDSVAAPLLRSMKHLGLDAKLVGGIGMCSPEFVRLAGDALTEESVVCAENGGVEAEAMEPLREFKAKFVRRFGVDVQLFAPYSYDGVMVMALAMKAAGSADPRIFLPALARTSYQGVGGPVAFDEHGNLTQGAVVLMGYRNGRRFERSVVR
jgi:branched-chain amino acid transport system substrate-binding protein